MSVEEVQKAENSVCKSYTSMHIQILHEFLHFLFQVYFAPIIRILNENFILRVKCPRRKSNNFTCMFRRSF